MQDLNQRAAEFHERHGSQDHYETSTEIEHRVHKAEGDMFTWCSLCREEEMCEKCKGAGSVAGQDCLECETSGRKI